jgi:hypothetical protein
MGVTLVNHNEEITSVSVGVLVAVPLVAVLTAALFAFHPEVALGGIAGAGGLTATKYVRQVAAVAGCLAFSGVLAWALRAPIR